MAPSRDIELTEEDLAIIYGRSAMAACLSSVAGALHALEECPDGAAAQDLLVKALSENLQKTAAPRAPFPMTEPEREGLKQLYRVFLGFYRDPKVLANLPRDSIQH